MKLLIIADDFTGAIDTGVQFATMNIQTTVTRNLDMLQFANCNSEVLVVDTESRHIDKHASYDKICTILEQVGKSIEYVYKKTDSALRGNIGPELSALLKYSANKNIMFVPAYPKVNRITKKGIQFIDGFPLHQSVFANDPLNPMKISSVPDIICSQIEVETHVIPTDQIRKLNAVNIKEGILIFDCETDSDLIEIAAVLSEQKLLNFTAGCAGFASVLPRFIDFKTTSIKHEKNSSPILVVSGSVNQITLQQIKYAESEGYQSFLFSPDELITGDLKHSSVLQKRLAQIATCLKSGKGVIIKTCENGDSIKTGIEQNGLYKRIANGLSIIVRQLFYETQIKNLVIFGGDTSLSIMDSLGINEISPIAEISPGTPLSVASFNDLNLNIVTKSGGFGEVNIISKIDKFLQS